MIELTIRDNIILKHKEFIFGEENINKRGRINKKLWDAYQNEYNVYGRNVYIFVINNLLEIVTSELVVLFELKKRYLYLLNSIPSKEVKTRVYEKLKKMFNEEYKYFYNDSIFNAYQFQKLLDVNICPYCGTQFIFLYESSSGSSRGTLDHYIDKANFPIFAVSIYNLVPSCKVCNSDFKKGIEANLTNYYSPYETGIIEYIKFQKALLKDSSDMEASEIVNQLDLKGNVEIDYVSALLGLNDDFNIVVDYSSAPPNISKKIEGNLELFKIRELYNIYHKPFVRDQIRKAYIYNYVYRTQLIKNFTDLFASDMELKAIIVPKIEDDNKYILNKLIRDIVLVETMSFSL